MFKEWRLLFRTIPNILSLVRALILAPAVVIFFLLGYHTLAGILFSLAAVTDFLDGYIARNYNQGSEIGKFLDGAADKVLVLCPLTCLVLVGVWWWLIALIFAREILILFGRLLINSTPELQAAVQVRRSGKIKATIQYVAIILVILGFPWPNFAIGIAAAFTIWSAYDYVIVFLELKRNIPTQHL